ncbi:MAG: hypothetical protein HOP08_20235 [Cyclobacteriaceae bacterium]|nr:hypothetical protein [Cyclobacteriaceae bacterium]
MTIKKSIFFVLNILPLVFVADNVQGQSLTLTKEQAIEDFRWLRFALEYVHPRLYKYDDKRTVDARFDSINRRISNEISGLDFLALVSKANATVRCGHLYTIPQGQLAKDVLEKRVLPFHIKILEDKIYILNDCSNSSIPGGSQILAINGKNDKEIFDAIIPGIASDGYIRTRKLRLMERYFFYPFHGFDLYYHLYVDRSDSFKIDYLEYGTQKRKTVTVKGISISERQKLLARKYSIDEQAWFKEPSPKFKIDKQNDYAILTLSRSFYDKTIDPNFDSLLSSAFSKIRSGGIKNLIIDLRNNEGGDERQQIELISYLYNKPFKLYQNIYLSHLDFRPLKQVILEKDTSKLLYNNDDEYMRRINDNLWINNYDYSDNLILKTPKENVFTGKLYVLINGISFSSAADLASDLKKTTDAVFIGEETGGAYEGPTGGDNIVIQLPNSKIMIRISPNIQIGHMYQKHPIGRGVLPTHTPKYTIKDILEGKDLEMELAKTLIQGKK